MEPLKLKKLKIPSPPDRNLLKAILPHPLRIPPAKQQKTRHPNPKFKPTFQAMRCFECGYQNSPDAKVCVKCGTKLSSGSADPQPPANGGMHIPPQHDGGKKKPWWAGSPKPRHGIPATPRLRRRLEHPRPAQHPPASSGAINAATIRSDKPFPSTLRARIAGSRAVRSARRVPAVQPQVQEPATRQIRAWDRQQIRAPGSPQVQQPRPQPRNPNPATPKPAGSLIFR